MTCLVDTSAIYAVLDGDDDSHLPVFSQWLRLLDDRETMVATNYVLTESVALCQNRSGLAMVRDMLARVVPALHVQWIGEDLHALALASLLSANRRDLSLVDCTSFEAMRRLGIHRAFTLDDHFREQGFEVVP